MEVQRMCVALRAVTDDRDGLAVELVEICVVVVEHGAAGYTATAASELPGSRTLPSAAVNGSARGRISSRTALR